MRLMIIPSVCLSILLCLKVNAQEIITISDKEYVLNTFLDHIESKNNAWLVELDSIKESTKSEHPVSPEDIEIFKRCKILSKTIPLEYNDQVKYYIDKYISANYRPYMNRLLGLSKHYFPIYEPILKESGLPEEVKFLSLVESSLNPHLVSSSGAVGPWQFMHVAAKEFQLEMNTYLDERKDPYSSSYAVSKYINDAYSQFGDWLVALASYNCGRGCVKRAIIRSGLQQPTFWQLAPFLPQETRNYIPKFIAMTYVLSEPDYYNIVAENTELDLEHKVLFVDNAIDLRHVATAIGMSADELKVYNPAYKRNLINGTADKPKRLLLPITPTANDSLLYLALHNSTSFQLSSGADESLALHGSHYKVKAGESLLSISEKLGVSIQNLKAWNGLTAKSAIVGKTLLIEKPVDTKLTQHVNAAYAERKKSTGSIVYTVKSGDSLDRIANRYPGVSVSSLKADNGLKGDMIKPGMKLKIIKKGKA